MIKELSITAVLVAGALVTFFLFRKKQNSNKVVLSEEIIDSELKITQIVEFFKSLELKQKRDVPFVAKGDCEEFRKMFGGSFPKKKEGYVTLFLGVYNEEKGTIDNHKLIHAKTVDSETQQMLGDENLVVLQ